MSKLFEHFDPVTQSSTSVEYDEDIGRRVFWKSQNTRPILEDAKRQASNFDPHFHPKQEMVKVATIPLVQWLRLVEVGIAHDPVAFRAWLNSREARLLRTDDGRRL